MFCVVGLDRKKNELILTQLWDPLGRYLVRAGPTLKVLLMAKGRSFLAYFQLDGMWMTAVSAHVTLVVLRKARTWWSLHLARMLMEG